MSIKLSKQEEKICNLLKTVAENRAPNDTILRICGGYVRDKLLRQESKDIDIAVNNMSGAEFARLVHKYMKDNNHPINDVVIIEARPDQSKHLETAVIKLENLEIDITNLRKETYAETRIPTIEPGTPLEDAHRRDLTINALFYNLMTNEIEDFLGNGLDDLEKGICRTPIDPHQTFIDDPLRVLRTIRFATKYRFKIIPEVIEAAKSKEVHEAFLTKISRERIWAEMIGLETPNGWRKGFLLGQNSALALELLKETGFRDLIFRPNNKTLNPWDTEQNNPNHELNIWEHTLSAYKYLQTVFDEDKLTDEDRIVRNFAMILHDIGKCDLCYRQEKEDGTYSYKRHEEGSAIHSKTILEKQLGAPTHLIARITRLVEEHMRLHMLEDKPTNRALRRFLRDLGDDWDHSVDLAIADALGKRAFHLNPGPVRERYEYFRGRLKELLETQGNTTTIKRPISGHDLINELKWKPGPTMGKFFKELDERLLDNPDMSKEQALDLAAQFDRDLVGDLVNNAS